MSAFLLAVAVVYLTYAALRLGLPQRAALALFPVPYDRVVSSAAVRHGERALFTTDVAVAWEVPQLRQQYRDAHAWSAARIHETAGYVACALSSMHIAPGDRVALIKTNHLDMHVLMTAIIRAGGVACPINDSMAAMDVHEYVMHIGARLMIADVATIQRLLALTGFGQDEDRRRAFGAGFDYHLVKPTSVGALHELLENIPAKGQQSTDNVLPRRL